MYVLQPVTLAVGPEYITGSSNTFALFVSVFYLPENSIFLQLLDYQSIFVNDILSDDFVTTYIMCVCVCVYIYMCVCIYIYIYIYIYQSIYIYIDGLINSVVFKKYSFFLTGFYVLIGPLQ